MNNIILNNSEVFPSKVICVGRNYIEHIAELNNEKPKEPVFFFKPNSSISSQLIFPKNAHGCHYEAEISFLIQKNKISAVAFGLDLTLRDVQGELKKKGLPWERAKCFDNSAVFSKFVSFDKDIKHLGLELYINGQLKQKGAVELMINKPQELIEELLTFSSFEDGDIFMSGTPKGVGEFKREDEFIGKILYKNEILIQKKFKVV